RGDANAGKRKQVAVFVAREIDRRAIRRQLAAELRESFMLCDESLFSSGKVEQVEIVVPAAFHATEESTFTVVGNIIDTAHPGIAGHKLELARYQINHERIARGWIEPAGIDRDLLAIVRPGIKTVVVLSALGQQPHAGAVGLDHVNLRIQTAAGSDGHGQ